MLHYLYRVVPIEESMKRLSTMKKHTACPQKLEFESLHYLRIPPYPNTTYTRTTSVYPTNRRT